MAFGFSGICFAVFVIANLMLPFTTQGTMFAIVFFWFGVSAPLALGGAWLGFSDSMEPLAFNSDTMPRPIPEQPWFLGIAPTVRHGGPSFANLIHT